MTANRSTLLSPEIISAYEAKARHLRAVAMHDAFAALARAVAHMASRALRPAPRRARA